MIKTIIKRDGNKEDFCPDKVNKWGEWASRSLGQYVDWPSIVLDTVAGLPEECTSTALQERLIKTCLDYDSWSYNRMAGRLYAALINKLIYGGDKPSVKDLHSDMVKRGFMVAMDYSEEEYAAIEKIINHRKDFKYSYYQLHQVRSKYGLKNRVTKEEFETPQFVFMRMAMALAEDQPKDRRMDDLAKWYKYFSESKINAPTPNYVNLGTPLRGFSSCCLYKAGDDAKSLAIGDHIAYTMTCMSAGIGAMIETRSVGDPIRGGAIEHLGKLGYYRSLVGAVKANKQNGRGGACTTHYTFFDPEIETLAQLKNPMSTEDKKIRGMDYSTGANKFFAKKAAMNEDVFLFNCFTAPDLFKALYSKDQDEFVSLYEKYEANKRFKKTYVSAREMLLLALNEAYETGRSYLHFTDEMNRHTPFKDAIYSSNLCQEVSLPTEAYYDMRDLYSEEDHGRGEVATCNLGGIVVGNVVSEEEYADVAYYTLLMIDKCIHLTEYALPHIGVTSKARMNAGVGIIGLAHALAKAKVKYSSEEGKKLIHEIAERHCWHLINASLSLGKELGNAPWIDKTLWPEGWLPLDTYNKNVDLVAPNNTNYPWEALRADIIENGGIRNSSLIAHMPSEASSKASGTTNGVYPVRELTLIKTDNDNVSYWAAPEGEKLSQWYESAWDIASKDMIDCYAIIQKWTDQAISSDLYRRVVGDDVVTSTEMLNDYFYMVKMGLKTRYYQNSLTSSGTELNSEVGCDGGACTL